MNPRDRTVTVVTPTLRRPAPLERALASLLSQRAPEGVRIDLLVVDNDAEAGARAQVERIARDAALPLRYVSEPRPGVATARNRGVAEATGDWIAFLDDDEEAAPDWIARMLEAAEALNADAAFGPVTARAEDGVELGDFGPYFERAFDLPDHADLTDKSAYLGTNNSMFRRAGRLRGREPFDESLNQCGGEDSLLLKRLRADGNRFVWAAQAGVTEWVPARRLTWSYVRRRKFLSGQIRSFVHQMMDPPHWGRLALWMAIGAAQATAAGAAALLFAPVDRARSNRLAATAWGGLGKVLWMERFRPGLYGSGLVS